LLSVGPHQAFTIYVSWPCGLPARAGTFTDSCRAERRAGAAALDTSDLNILFFILALAADGVLGARIASSLRLHAAASAIVAPVCYWPFNAGPHRAGLIQRAGRDRIGAGRLLLPCSLVVACGLGGRAGHSNGRSDQSSARCVTTSSVDGQRIAKATCDDQAARQSRRPAPMRSATGPLNKPARCGQALKGQ